MRIEDFAMWYFIIGLSNCILNGAFRKIEADALLGLAWFIVWPLTPIGAIARLGEWLYNYQPFRRTKIYLLRKF
jgi:hypothetical protein